MKYRVIGDTMPAVEVMFDAPGEGMYTQSGGMAWMTEGIEMSTNAKRRADEGNRKNVCRRILIYGYVQGATGRSYDRVCFHGSRADPAGGCDSHRGIDLPERGISVCPGERKFKYYVQQKNLSRAVWRRRIYSAGSERTGVFG